MKISDFFTRVDSLNVKQSRKLMEEGEVNLLDVREPSEYNHGHIPGTQFQPLSSLLDNIGSLDLSKKVVTYCKRGPRSKSAAVLLKRNGFEKVAFMEGGIDAWNGLVATGHYEGGLMLLDGCEFVEDYILMSWSLEDGTGKFYTRLRDLCNDAEAAQVFQALVDAEQKHKSKLLKAYSEVKGEGISEDLAKIKSRQGYMEGGVSIEEAVKWVKSENSSLIQMLEISMQIETNSLDLYMKMEREADNDAASNLFKSLIEEEQAHLSILGQLLDSKINKQSVSEDPPILHDNGRH